MELKLIQYYAIIFIFIVLFSTAAIDKFKVLEVPEWFIKQFQSTWIAKKPFGVKSSYWFIAFLELALTILFFVSVFNFNILPYALGLSMFFFGILCFGLRLSGDYQGSANMFIYFTAALLCFNSIT